MTTETRLRTIQTICWIGVGADAIWAVALVCPSFYGFLTGRPHIQPDLFLRLTMGIGASLMAGWTLLLAWTARKPIERRAIMLFTVVPVLAGLSIVASIGFLNGNAANIWILGKFAFLTAAMLAGYHMANTIAKGPPKEAN